MIFTEEQEKFINYNAKNSIILSATAGSGKTRCLVQRVKELLNRKVSSDKILLFSYTNSAVDELKERIDNKSIKITTIHSFCLGFLKRIKKDRSPVTFHDFLSWYNKKNAPEDENQKQEFEKKMFLLYDEAEYYSSRISTYKLEIEDDIPTKKPEYYDDYVEFLLDTDSMDFSDILLETKELLRDNRFLRLVKDKYDYIFVDEYQDTSTIQMDILLKLNAKYYYIIGDKNQSIFGYTGVSCDKIEEMLKKRRTTEEMNLTVNFRSDVLIVENSNKYSSLKAVPNNTNEGKIDKRLIYLNDVEYLLKNKEEVVVLVRTNAIIRDIECELLKRRCPIRYFNYIRPEEINNIKENKANEITKKKFEDLKVYFNDDINNIIKFIEEHKSSKAFVTTIHKAKGREFEICVVVNSLSDEIVEENNLRNKISQELINRYSFNSNKEEGEDFEAKNIHYVAITRPQHELYFMSYSFKKKIKNEEQKHFD
jgi:superfamily I DNA/RNA helicase